MSTGSGLHHGPWRLVQCGPGSWRYRPRCGHCHRDRSLLHQGLPVNDPWNFAYQVALGANNLNGWLDGTAAADLGNDDFIFGSRGRNGALGTLTYVPATPDLSRYNVSGMGDFDNDLVAWAGNWVIAPSTVLVQAASGS